MMIFKQAALQFGAAVLTLTLWAAADSWYTTTGLALAKGLSLLLAAIAGATLATVIHEWFHLAGIRLAGAAYRVPDKLGLFIYDYDFASNNLRQFNVMSIAGQLGSWVAVALLLWLVPADNAGRAMLASAALGSAVFAGLIELPPLWRAQTSGDPLAELSKIDARVLRSAGLGAGAALLTCWLLLG